MTTATKTAHTPGPWVIIRDRVEIEYGWDRKKGYETRMHVVSKLHGMPVYVCSISPGQKKDSERDANARLIAAAPQLLEAAKAVLEHCALIHKHWGDGNNLDQALTAEKSLIAAIAAAEGR